MSFTVQCSNQCVIEWCGEKAVSAAYISETQDQEIVCQICGKVMWKPMDRVYKDERNWWEYGKAVR